MNDSEDDFEGMASTEELEETAPYEDVLPEPEEEPVEENEKETAEAPTIEPLPSSTTPTIIATPTFLPQLSAAAARAGRATGKAASGTLTRIGSGIRSPVNEYDDELNELFEGIHDYDSDVYFEDLVRVDEEDIFGDGGEDMSDILEVDPEDFMGEPIEGPASKMASHRRYSPSARGGVPPSSVSGIGAR